VCQGCSVNKALLSPSHVFTFLGAVLKCEFKRFTAKTWRFFDSVSSLDSLLDCECNPMKDMKTKSIERKILIEEEGATCRV
jgi:hypothetical protein